MLGLSAFADEISPDLDEQIRVCIACGITHIELRAVDNRNVLDFRPEQREAIRKKLRSAGLGVISIASPIGKVTIDSPWEDHFARFKIAVESAEFFNAPFIRIFSYYLPSPAASWGSYRDEVMRRMRLKISYLGARNITLLHENEKDIYGQSGASCLDLLRTIDSPKFRAAFDFANFVQVKEHPLQNWHLLRSFVAHIHVKDARLSDGGIVQAGAGDGDIPSVLTDAYANGYRKFLSMEPHLAAAGQFSGFSGAALFERAVKALRKVCLENSIPLGAPPKS